MTIIMDQTWQTSTVVILKYVKDYPDHMWFLGSSFLVIINQDKNVMQRMQPTALFSLFVLYYWFSRSGTNNSRVPHILQDKSRFLSISGFTDQVRVMENFTHHTPNFGLITHHAYPLLFVYSKPIATRENNTCKSFKNCDLHIFIFTTCYVKLYFSFYFF